ncbi:FtsQ-type POTRA domain-containing protein [Streptomyces montanus]|uniref:Cell division protein FtsQ n=1 Tax=Streptomyces montanus TaxID=2580423 RepID=A0A5R9FCD5_9ACTN|nr:FtsQ-type POTRA domain-containing protein [Streptomyces montanus]TLS39850.1 FtsQ-type POTRA domain-containing protein [Streptomyces montanus]
MAGPTTAERGERERVGSGPPRPPRLRRLPRERLPRPRTLIILLVCVALLGTGGVWVLYGSQWLRVERVSASGMRVLTAQQVLEAADVPVGSPMISVDTDAIEARLRRKLPRIDSVDVVRSWPHGIGLKVAERTPVVIIENTEKRANFVEVDAKGVRYATVSRAPKGVPALELPAPLSAARPSSRTSSQSASLRRFGIDRLVREAVRVAGSLPAAVARDTRMVKVRSYDSISLELRGNRTVAWGSGEEGRAKARALTALMKAAPEARYFDVSVPTAPASSGS